MTAVDGKSSISRHRKPSRLGRVRKSVMRRPKQVPTSPSVAAFT